MIPPRPCPALSAVVVGHGKCLFDEFPASQVAVRRTPVPPGAEADFLAIPFPLSPPAADSDPETWASQLPSDLLRAAAEGRTVLVFDVSSEGPPHSAAVSAWLHQALGRLGVPVSSCVYVTQERNYREDYARYCREAGWASPMSVLTYDLWIKRFHAQFEGHNGEIILDSRLEKLRRRGRERERRFVSLNLTARTHKVLFLLRLIRDGLWDSGFVSFGGFDRKRRLGEKNARQFLKKEMRREPEFAGLVDELAPHLADLEAKGRVLLGRVDEDEAGRVAKTPIHDLPLDEYNRSWFSVVTESDMRSRPSRITEKAFKPLANLHPLLVLGNPGALGMIREFGYRTFSDVFDESYDEEPDPLRRFEALYREFLRLVHMEDAELAAISDRMEETLVFNARRALIEMPARYREQIDPALLAQLTAIRRRAQAATESAGDAITR